MRTDNFLLVPAFGTAHVFSIPDHRWIGATSLEDGDGDCAALIEHEGRPIVVVFGGSLYETHLSHRGVDITRSEVLWALQGTTSTDVVPITSDKRTLVARSTIGKWGNQRDLIDPLTGVDGQKIAGMGPGTLYGSGGSLFALVHPEEGLRVIRDGVEIARLSAPKPIPPTVSTEQLGDALFTVTESVLFQPRMKVYLDDAGGFITTYKERIDAYTSDGVQTRALQLPEGASVADASWTPTGWLVLVRSGGQARVLSLDAAEPLLERPWSSGLRFAYGGILRDGLSLTDVVTGAALPPLVLPPTPELLARVQLDETAQFGDRMARIIAPLREREAIGVSPDLQRFGIKETTDVRVTADSVPHRPGPVTATEPVLRALTSLSKWAPKKPRVAVTAAALAAHEEALGVPLPAESIPLFASGLAYLLVEGCMAPERIDTLRRYSSGLPPDLTPLAAFAHDLTTELSITWAFRYTTRGVDFYRFEHIWGSRGSGIRRESYTRMNITGPLPLHTLVTEEAARLWYAIRQDSYFTSEPTPASVALDLKLG